MTWLIVPVAVGLIALAVEVLALRRHLRSVGPPLAAELPPVTILKPLKGVDCELEENLESFFALDYPQFEIILGAASGEDPALDVARRVAAAHPQIPSRVVVGERLVGYNPKVNNLSNLDKFARYDVILISDSNVRVPPAYLRELAVLLSQPGVGLVSSPVAAPEGRSLGARLEGLQLNTYVIGGVAAMHAIGGVCVMGKSMLLRRATLEEIGGFRFLSRFLAEDQVCGQEVARRGWGVALARRPIVNVTGPVTVRQFLARHLRWATIRRRLTPLGYLGELALNPVFLAAAGVALRPSAVALGVLIATVAVKSVLDLLSERVAGVKRHWAAYPMLVAGKDILLGFAWLVPWFSLHVAWRGNRLQIGNRTRLVPAAAPGWLDETGIADGGVDLSPVGG